MNQISHPTRLLELRVRCAALVATCCFARWKWQRVPLARLITRCCFGHSLPRIHRAAPSILHCLSTSLVATFILANSHAGIAATISFTPIGHPQGGAFPSEAWAVSADGAVVVGNAGGEAFRWTADGGMVGLGRLDDGSSAATGVSADGTVIVGASGDVVTSGVQAFRWTADNGMVALGDLGGGASALSASRRLGVSADGSVVVGRRVPSGSFRAFRWTADLGMTDVGDLPGGAVGSSAWGVSADGTVVVGASSSASGTEAFLWTADDGMVGLGDLGGGSFFSEAWAVSANGAVVVGYSNSAAGTEAFRWSADDGMVGLGALSAGNLNSLARGVSADGAVIVGYSNSASSALGIEAFRWTADEGMVSLKDILVNGGVSNVTDWTLTSATGVSADGRTIVGFGVNPNGITEAWVATVPEPSTLALASIGALVGACCIARRQWQQVRRVVRR